MVSVLDRSSVTKVVCGSDVWLCALRGRRSSRYSRTCRTKIMAKTVDLELKKVTSC
jgi:hypothetical protein